MPYSSQEYLQRFMMHRAALIELLEKIPDAQGDFKAWEGGMSFTSLTDHLNSAGLNLVNMALGKERVKLDPSASLSGAVARLKDTTVQLQSMLSQMSDEQLSSKTAAFRGIEMPVYTLVDFIREHEVRHKGQLWMMARMIGVEPAMFVKMG